tara:strand:- start:5 stop:280 length:276 start_codon:yes stop_codon:yes gene_type:complete
MWLLVAAIAVMAWPEPSDLGQVAGVDPFAGVDQSAGEELGPLTDCCAAPVTRKLSASSKSPANTGLDVVGGNGSGALCESEVADEEDGGAP